MIDLGSKQQYQGSGAAPRKRNKCVLLCNRKTTEQGDSEEGACLDRKKKCTRSQLKVVKSLDL